MKSLLRAIALVMGASLLLGGDCVFGRPIVDERNRYYPSDGVVSCSGTRCASLPAYELELPAPLADSPCTQDLPTAELIVAAQAGAVLAGMRYELSSDLPLEVNLSTLDLRDACVVLSGPVRLTLGSGSRLTRVAVLLGPSNPADPEADTRRSARETPNLYLGHTELDRVSLQAIDEDAPSGSAQIEFSACIQCQTRIDSLSVTESHMQNSRLGAGSLTMVGGSFDAVELTFEYGLLAGVLANDIRTAACNTLSLVGATIAGRASQIGPCDCGSATASQTPDASARSDAGQLDASEPGGGSGADAAESDAGQPGAVQPDAGQPDAGQPDAGAADAGLPDAGPPVAELPDASENDAGRFAPDAAHAGDAAQASASCNGATISQTTFFGGMVDGKVQAENSTFRSVLFARHAPTSLDLWSANVELSVVCDHRMEVRLDKTSGIGCSSCDAPMMTTACTLDRAPELTVNKCGSFKGQLRACEPPLPTRRTPVLPMPPKLGR
jgi:hypothetical protein